MTVVVTNLFGSAVADVTAGAAEGEKVVAKDVLEWSQATGPVISGALKASGKTDGGVTEYTADHAEGVHENPNGRGYKFLENALKATKDPMGKIAAAVKKEIG